MPNLSKFTKSEISKLFACAQRCVRHPGLDILLALRNFNAVELAPTLAGPLGRILVITPKKIGNAPTRNRVRRRLKAAYQEEKLFERGYDCVVIVKPDGIHLTFEQLRELLKKAFAKATSSPLDKAQGSRFND